VNHRDLSFRVNLSSSGSLKTAHHGDHTGRPDAVAHAHALVVGVLAPPDEELVPHEVGTVVDHEAAVLHPAGSTPVQEGGHVGAVAAGLVGATLEVPVLVEDDLEKKSRKCLSFISPRLFVQCVCRANYTDCFLVYPLPTLPMFDALCSWESVQQPAAARRLLYLIRAVTGFCYSNDLEADE